MKHTLRAALAALLAVLLMLGAMGCSEKSPPAADPPPSTDTGTPTPPATEVAPPAPTPEAPAPKGPEPCDIISRTGTLWTPMTEAFKIHSYTDVNSVHCRVVQGGCTDGTYVYAVHSAANTLVIYKTDGTPVGVCALPAGANSAQSICHIGSTFYIGYNVSDAGGILYTATVTVK